MARFYLDQDIRIAVAVELRLMGHQATTTRDRGAEGQPDYLQLLTAAQQRWILVTHNWDDFRLLHGAWVTWRQAWGASATHAGVLVLTQARDAHLRVKYAVRLHEIADASPGPLDNQLYRYRRSTAGFCIREPFRRCVGCLGLNQGAPLADYARAPCALKDDDAPVRSLRPVFEHPHRIFQ